MLVPSLPSFMFYLAFMRQSCPHVYLFYVYKIAFIASHAYKHDKLILLEKNPVNTDYYV